MADALIPPLREWGLDVVPGYCVDPETGREDPTWRARYFTWYENARDWRIWAQEESIADERFRTHLDTLCSRSPALFALTWLTIEEPRSMEYFDNEADGDAADDIETILAQPAWDLDIDYEYRTVHPYIPFSYQVEAFDLLTKVILGPLRGVEFDILWDKARGIGMSYAFLAWAYWGWLHVPGLRGTILTEKWDKAEKTHSLNTLFGKFDLFWDATPDWKIPPGFRDKGDKDAHRQKGMLFNPENGARIETEPTTADSTRGFREAYIGVDECAFHEYFRDTWATIHGTTKHCIGWSSANYRYGTQWEDVLKNARKSPRSARVITLERYENPHQDARWEQRTRAVFAANGMLDQFEVEYMRNASAGYGTLIYKAQVDRVPWVDGGYEPNKPIKLSVDPGSVGPSADDTAFIAWQTHYTIGGGQKKIRLLEGIQIGKMPVQFWAHVWTGIEPRPGDLSYPLWMEGFFDGRPQAIMRVMRDVPPGNIFLYGDPAMRRKDVTTESWISLFEKTTRELREREGLGIQPITVTLPWDYLNKRNNMTDRRVGAREALMMAEWSKQGLTGDPNGVGEVIEALSGVRQQEMTERSTRAPGTLHTRHSHFAQAWEFGMTVETLQLTPQELQQARPLRMGKGKSARPVRSMGQIKSGYFGTAARTKELNSLVGIS